MSAALATDQFRILRNARDGSAAAARVSRPKGCWPDVERLAGENLVTSRHGALRPAQSGATQLTSGLPAEPAQGD
jgi:hypothetical protein